MNGYSVRHRPIDRVDNVDDPAIDPSLLTNPLTDGRRDGYRDDRFDGHRDKKTNDTSMVVQV